MIYSIWDEWLASHDSLPNWHKVMDRLQHRGFKDIWERIENLRKK
jgi:hypothetical protein